MRTALVALSITPVLCISPGLAQVYTRPDSAVQARAAAIAALTYWVETTHGVSEQSVMLRNNSTREIQVLSYEVFECANISSRTCKVHRPGPVVPPGKTIRLVTIVPRRLEDQSSFRFRFEAGYVPQPPVSDSLRP